MGCVEEFGSRIPVHSTERTLAIESYVGETARYALLAFFNPTRGKISSSREKPENLFGQGIFWDAYCPDLVLLRALQTPGSVVAKGHSLFNHTKHLDILIIPSSRTTQQERFKYNICLFFIGTDYTVLNSGLLFCYRPLLVGSEKFLSHRPPILAR